MADIDFPNDLIELERSAWAAIQGGTLTVDTALAVQNAISAFAYQGGHERIAVEMQLKKTVRHPAPAESEAAAA